MTRRYGLIRQGAGTRIVATFLVFGLIAGFGVPQLAQAGVPVWGVLVLGVLVVAVPVYFVVRSERA